MDVGVSTTNNVRQNGGVTFHLSPFLSLSKAYKLQIIIHDEITTTI